AAAGAPQREGEDVMRAARVAVASEQDRVRRRARPGEGSGPRLGAVAGAYEPVVPLGLVAPSHVLGHVTGVGPSAAQIGTLHRLQQSYGNRAVHSLLQRSCSGGNCAKDEAEEDVQRLPVIPAGAAPAVRLPEGTAVAVQRQITDGGVPVDFDNNPPAWFTKLPDDAQEEVVVYSAKLASKGDHQDYREALVELGYMEPEESGEGGDYTEERASRRGATEAMFKQVYKVGTLKRTGSGQGLITKCREPNCRRKGQKLVLDVRQHRYKPYYTERGFKDKHGKPRRPPVCHPTDMPAAHLLAAFEELLVGTHPHPVAYRTTDNYKSAALFIEWDLPSSKLTPGHIECNARHKDTLWANLSPQKQDKIRKAVQQYLEKKNFITVAGKKITWL
ncbi:MAG: hypothetical protein ACRDJN_19505, partial [Chloroflexota bacterium]